jgi:hypothetical protein
VHHGLQADPLFIHPYAENDGITIAHAEECNPLNP